MKKLNNKGFSLIELLVAIVVISLSLIALLNTFVFFLSSRVKYTVAMDSLLAARYLALNLTKSENCNSTPACGIFLNVSLLNKCKNSLNYNAQECCNQPCGFCLPTNYKPILYSFNAVKLQEKVYKLQICWKYGQILKNKIFFVNILGGNVSTAVNATIYTPSSAGE